MDISVKRGFRKTIINAGDESSTILFLLDELDDEDELLEMKDKILAALLSDASVGRVGRFVWSRKAWD